MGGKERGFINELYSHVSSGWEISDRCGIVEGPILRGIRVNRKGKFRDTKIRPKQILWRDGNYQHW